MSLIYIIVFIFSGSTIAYICKRNSSICFNFGSFFAIIWMVTGVLSNSGLFGFYKPSDIVNISMIVGMIIYGVVYAFRCPYQKMTYSDIASMDITVKEKMLLLANIIAFFFMIPFMRTSLSLIAANGFSYLRAVNFSDELITGRSTVVNLILQDICFPLFFVSIILSGILLFINKRSGAKIFIIGLINITIYEIINGARNGFIIIIILLIFIYIKILSPFVHENINIPRKLKWTILFTAFALIAVVIYITSQRSLGNKSIFETFYYYYFAGPAYLSNLLNNLGQYEINNDFFFGSGSFGFVYNIVVTAFSFFGIRLFNSGHVLNSVLSNQYFAVSSTVKLNAMATMYFPFIMDYGYAGIVIFPFIFALTSRYVSRKTVENNNIRWHAMGIFWLYIIYRTIYKWELIAMSSFFIFAFIVLFTTNNKGGDICSND